MKTIIAGSRGIQDYWRVKEACRECGWLVTSVVSGGARGIDRMGEIYAQEKGIPLEVVKADWESYGKAAGPIRNKHMASISEALIAIWDGKSPGTKNMIDCAKSCGLKVFIKIP